MSRTKKVGIKRNLTKQDVAKRKSKIMPNKPRPKPNKRVVKVRAKKRGRPPKPAPKVGETWDVRGHGLVRIETITRTRIGFSTTFRPQGYEWKRTSFMRQAKPYVRTFADLTPAEIADLDRATPVDPATDVRPERGTEAAEGLEDGIVG